MYKDQTHGGKKLTSEHEEMLSHSVHDAEGAIETASEKTYIRYRKEDDNKHHIS